MVFRGKPSKACQRCRDRKLRCDLHTPSCSACIRAHVQCTGYRDTNSLRIANQTQTVAHKTHSKLSKRSQSALKDLPFVTRPKYLPPDLQIQARTLFFLYYISDFSRTWDFLSPFFDPSSTPEYLTWSIDAVSLAFLSHQVYSPTARSLSRQKYITALRQTNTALQSSNNVAHMDLPSSPYVLH